MFFFNSISDEDSNKPHYCCAANCYGRFLRIKGKGNNTSNKSKNSYTETIFLTSFAFCSISL